MRVIYGLHHPETAELRYVGATRTDLRRRMSRHLAHCRQEGRNSPLVRWLRELGRPPHIAVLRHVPEGECLATAERRMIAALREEGRDLLNSHRAGGYVER